jgi:hypothetical protein
MLRKVERRAARVSKIATYRRTRVRAARDDAQIDVIALDPATRIVVTGRPGAGKTWLAERIAASRRWPVHHLDEVGHIAGGGTPLRAPAELAAFVDSLAAEPAWVCEGVDVGWTDPLFARADAILWLDDGSIRPAASMVKRFVSQALAEARRNRGRRRYLRFGDYLMRTRELVGTLAASTMYATSRNGRTTPESRASFASALAPHRAKVLRLRTRRDRDRAIDILTRPR